MAKESKPIEPHPAAELFPALTGTEFTALRDDIKANGQRIPIYLYDGKILDGRNRYLACCAVGVEPKFERYTGDDPVAFVISLNLHRRHLTESQRAMVAARAKERFEEEAKKKQSHGKTAPGRTLSANLREASSKASARAGDLLKVSPRSVESAAKVIHDGAPELAQAVDSGAVKVSAAAVVAALPVEEQAQVVAAGPKAVREKAAEIRRGQSRVNGVLVDDPPDIAEARAAGRIGADVVPDVSQPEDDGGQVDAGSPAAEIDPSESFSDEEWLNTLPARHVLTGRQRAIFDADALAYRRLAKPRDTFKHHAVRVLNKARKPGEYGRRVNRFLTTDHPRHWLVCPAVKDGGCGGSGQVSLIGQCPKCLGKGYWIK